MEDIKAPTFSKKSSSKKINKLLIFFVLLTFGFGLSTVYFARENYVLKNNPDSLLDKEKNALVKKVSKFMSLPKDEEPTIATINDLTALGDQPFFRNAQIGDKVLIYSIAKKAILFNPTENKVIEVAPINDNPPTADLENGSIEEEVLEEEN